MTYNVLMDDGDVKPYSLTPDCELAWLG